MGRPIHVWKYCTEHRTSIFPEIVVTWKMMVKGEESSQEHYFHQTFQSIAPILQTLDYPVLFALILNNSVKGKGKCQTDP